MTAIGAGMTWLIIFSSYGLAFWYGIKLIMEGREDCFKDIDETLKNPPDGVVPPGTLDCDIDYDASTMLIVQLNMFTIFCIPI